MLDLKDPRLRITFFRKRFHLYQIPIRSQIPKDLLSSTADFLSVTTTSDEISIVNTVNVDPQGLDLDVKHEGPWSCFKLWGPMDLTLTGG